MAKFVSGSVGGAMLLSDVPPPSSHQSLPEVLGSGSSSATTEKVKKEKSEERPMFHTTRSTDS